jgi:hypothetical protein
MAQQPTAAGAIFPHLKSSTPSIVERRHEPASVADAMYAHLKPPPPKPANAYRESLIRNLRETVARLQKGKP